MFSYEILDLAIINNCLPIIEFYQLNYGKDLESLVLRAVPSHHHQMVFHLAPYISDEIAHKALHLAVDSNNLKSAIII